MKPLAIPLLLLMVVPERELPPTPETEQTLFQGVWQVMSLQDKGEMVQPEVARRIEVHVVKDQVTLRTGDEVGGSFRMKIDPSHKQRQVDFSASDGEDAGKTYAAIYLFENDLLRVVMNERGQHRPTGFDSKSIAGMTVFVLRKK
jgi:uncharacterized protein (TIGR03067 family)